MGRLKGFVLPLLGMAMFGGWLAPAQAQVGGIRAVADTQRVPTQFHVFKLYKGQRLVASWGTSDTLSVPGWAGLEEIRWAKLLDDQVRFVDPVDQTKAGRFDMDAVPTGSTAAVSFQATSGTMYITGGQDVAVADGGTGASDAATARTNLGLDSAVGTNLASPKHPEYIALDLRFEQNGALDQIKALDATSNFSGTSSILTGGFHTTSTFRTIEKGETSAADQDSNKVFQDTGDRKIKIKKTSGSAITSVSILSIHPTFSNVNISTVVGYVATTVVADASFTGSPSSLVISLLNSSGAVIDPYSLLGSNGDFTYWHIVGVVIE